MFHARDCAYAKFLLEILERDLERSPTRPGPQHGPQPGADRPSPWNWSVQALWMAEEVAREADSLQVPEAIRLEMLDLARLARQRVREARALIRRAA